MPRLQRIINLAVHLRATALDALHIPRAKIQSKITRLPVVNLRAPDPMWERDYLQDLMGDLEHEIVDLDVDDACRTTFRMRPVVVWNSNVVSIREIERVVRKLRPVIVIHLSDEWGTKDAGTRWYPQVPLVLRQHYFPWYTKRPNAVMMPLGYMVGMLDGQSSTGVAFRARIKPPTERGLRWSFIGALKADRAELVRAFQELSPYELHTNNGIAPATMRDIYLDSVFVPCGRGNLRLDCFRLYEASLCGAIPVVVGSETEIADAFDYDAPPPWVFARSWPDAVTKCRALLETPAVLDERHSQVVEWWDGQLNQMRDLIAMATQGRSSKDLLEARGQMHLARRSAVSV